MFLLDREKCPMVIAFEMFNKNRWVKDGIVLRDCFIIPKKGKQGNNAVFLLNVRILKCTECELLTVSASENS